MSSCPNAHDLALVGPLWQPQIQPSTKVVSPERDLLVVAKHVTISGPMALPGRQVTIYAQKLSASSAPTPYSPRIDVSPAPTQVGQPRDAFNARSVTLSSVSALELSEPLSIVARGAEEIRPSSPATVGRSPSRSSRRARDQQRSPQTSAVERLLPATAPMGRSATRPRARPVTGCRDRSYRSWTAPPAWLMTSSRTPTTTSTTRPPPAEPRSRIMTTPQTARIFLRNDTGDVADLVLSHQYSTSTADTMRWPQVASGATVGPLVVHFETGLGSGLDRWFAMATIGSSVRRRVFTTRGTQRSPGKYCTLMDGDQNADHTFSVSTGRLAITLTSGSCTARMLLQGTVTAPVATNVFVLMLENRSFDHVFGWFRPDASYPGRGAHLDDVQPRPHRQPAHQRPAGHVRPAGVGADPGHEFKDVWLQLTGTTVPNQVPAGYPTINSSGFATSYADHCAHRKYGAVPTDDADLGEVMSGAAMSRQLVIHQLAEQFALCDHWFSSLPGPTWPNRFLPLAGSSGGLDDSPSNLDMASARRSPPTCSHAARSSRPSPPLDARGASTRTAATSSATPAGRGWSLVPCRSRLRSPA